MGRRAQFGSLLIVALVAGSAACGGSGKGVTRSDQTTTTTRIDRILVDGIIDLIVNGNRRVFRSVSGATDGETTVQMMVASRDLKAAADHLRPRSLGVPESTTEATRTALIAMALALDAAISCRQHHVDTSACESTLSLVRDRAEVVGKELVGLILYGTRSATEISPRLGK